MKNQLEELYDDLNDFSLPKNLDSYDKINCTLNIGKRICWYYKEDKEYFESMGETPRDYPNDIFIGIVIPRYGIELMGVYSELDVEDVVVIMISSPEEKSYPECFWLSLKKILDDESLVEIFSPFD